MPRIINHSKWSTSLRQHISRRTTRKIKDLEKERGNEDRGMDSVFFCVRSLHWVFCSFYFAPFRPSNSDWLYWRKSTAGYTFTPSGLLFLVRSVVRQQRSLASAAVCASSCRDPHSVVFRSALPDQACCQTAEKSGQCCSMCKLLQRSPQLGFQVYSSWPGLLSDSREVWPVLQYVQVPAEIRTAWSSGLLFLTRLVVRQQRSLASVAVCASSCRDPHSVVFRSALPGQVCCQTAEKSGQCCSMCTFLQRSAQRGFQVCSSWPGLLSEGREVCSMWAGFQVCSFWPWHRLSGTRNLSFTSHSKDEAIVVK
jgi:hypothetical protein